VIRSRTLLALLTLPLLAAFALAAAGCGAMLSPWAARVNSQEISRSSFERELTALRDNKQLVQSLRSQGQGVSTTKGTVNAQIAAGWLTNLVQQTVIDREFERRHLKISAEDRQGAQSGAEQTFGTAKTFAAFPRWFRDRVLERDARIVALGRAVVKPPTEADGRAYFDQNKAQICPSGKTVAHILVKTKAEADAIEAQLAAGGDFAALAKAQSTDTGSGQQGGGLGCLGAQQFVAEFDAAANALAVGQTSAPVQTQYGFHVIRVGPVTFEALRSQIGQTLGQQAQQRFSDDIGKRLAKAKVSVDPRYGKVQRGSGSQPSFRIVPPTTPAVREKPAPRGSSTTSGQPPPGQQTPSPTG
jgi:parvulin-like peptidyl-prolyl isomerase